MASGKSAGGKSGHDRFVVEAAADPASPFAGLIGGARRAHDPATLVGGAPLALWALPVQPAAPPHPWLDMLTRTTIDGVILPTGRTVAHGADWILCPPPSHPVLGLGEPVDEQLLLNKILRPVALILERLETQQLTHRAIRPENLFISEDGVELGPFWLTPPATLQPAVYETPSSASCIPQARGSGTIADDMYALGVTILALYLGETPMAGVPDAEVIERKLWQGSYAALTEGRRISFGLGEIIAAMVADQPSQRPTPERLRRASVLTGPAASSRKRVNAAVPMVLAGREVWNAPQLAYLAGEFPDDVFRALEYGQVDAWLRRGLNEVVLAERLETVIHPGGLRLSGGKARELDQKARALLLSRIARMLDPEAPILWERMRMMPEGLGGLLAASGHHPLAPEAGVNALLSSEMLIVRALDEPSGLKRELAIAAARRAMASTRHDLAMAKLTYELNPTFACASPTLARHPISALAQLVETLDAVCADVDGGRLLDVHLQAFISVRRTATGLKAVRGGDQFSDLRLLASLAADFKVGSVPHLAKRLAAPIVSEIDSWPGTSIRAARRASIEVAVAAGDLAGLLAQAGNSDQLAAAGSRQAEAHARIAALDRLCDALASAGPARHAAALRFGREGVAVVGAAACAIALLLQVM